MTSEGSSSRDRRKLRFDPVSKTFFFETKIDATQRVIKKKYQDMYIVNRCEDQKLDHYQRQIKYTWHVFQMKHSREREEAKEALKKYISHRLVLENEAKNGEQGQLGCNPNLGKYGLSGVGKDIFPKIQRQKRQLTSSARRRSQARKLLEERREMQVFDRNMSTEDIFAQRRRSKSADSVLLNTKDNTFLELVVAELEKTPEIPEKPNSASTPTIVLPPIQVSKRKVKFNTSNGSSPTRRQSNSVADEPCLTTSEETETKIDHKQKEEPNSTPQSNNHTKSAQNSTTKNINISNDSDKPLKNHTPAREHTPMNTRSNSKLSTISKGSDLSGRESSVFVTQRNKEKP